MIKLSSRRAAVVLSSSAIALTAAALPAQAATTGWRVNAEFAVRGASSAMFSVDAVSASDAWATGVTLNAKKDTFQPVLRHWTGKNWQPVTLPSAVAKSWQNSFPIFTQVAASSASNVWVFSSYPGGRYLHLNGKRWGLGGLPGGGTPAGTAVEVTAVSDLSKNNAWAFGAKVNLASSTPTAVPYAAHFNGRKWTSQRMPGKGAVTAVSVVSSASVWAVVGQPNTALSPVAVQGTITPLVLHWTPTGGWHQAAVQPALPAGANLASIQTAPGGTIWIGGLVKNGRGTTAFAAHWAAPGSAWTLADLGSPSAATWELTDIAPAGGGGLWAVAVAGNVKGQPARLWHLTGETWSQVAPAFGKSQWILVQLAAVPGTTSVWGAGVLKSGKTGNGFIALDGPTPR